MYKSKNDCIKSEDCPDESAPPYPGKKSRNNPEGSLLNKSEFIDSEIDKWVRHFENSEKYHQTYFAVRANYLYCHMKRLFVSSKDIKDKLIKTETKLAKESEDENLSQSQDQISSEMDIDNDSSDSDIFRDDETDKKKSRWEKETDIYKVLSLSDEELFETGLKLDDHIENSAKYKQREKQYFLSKSDDELFKMYDRLSPYLQRSDEFKERHKQFVETYIEDNFALSSSQDILLRLSQTPSAVQSSEVYKDKLRHLSFEEKSERLIKKNLENTLSELKKTPEGRKQSKIIIAAVSHPTFGDPGLNLDERTRKEVKMMKENLLKGDENTLKLLNHKKKMFYPAVVEAIARDHWMENTIVEPAKKTGKATEEDGEIVPDRYMDKTIKEYYENFKEECSEKVKIEMTKVSQEMIEKLLKRPDSEDKLRRLQYAEALSRRFVIINEFFIHICLCLFLISGFPAWIGTLTKNLLKLSR